MVAERFFMRGKSIFAAWFVRDPQKMDTQRITTFSQDPDPVAFQSRRGTGRGLLAQGAGE